MLSGSSLNPRQPHSITTSSNLPGSVTLMPHLHRDRDRAQHLCRGRLFGDCACALALLRLLALAS